MKDISMNLLLVLIALCLFSCAGNGGGGGGTVANNNNNTYESSIKNNPNQPIPNLYSYMIPDNTGNYISMAESNISIYQGTKSSYTISLQSLLPEAMYGLSIFSVHGMSLSVTPVVKTIPETCIMSPIMPCSIEVDATNVSIGNYVIIPQIYGLAGKTNQLINPININVISNQNKNTVVLGDLVFTKIETTTEIGKQNNLVLSLEGSTNVENLNVNISSNDNSVVSVTTNSCVLSTKAPNCVIPVTANNLGSTKIFATANNYSEARIGATVSSVLGKLQFSTGSLNVKAESTATANISLVNSKGVSSLTVYFKNSSNIINSLDSCTLNLANNFNCKINVIGYLNGATSITAIADNYSPVNVDVVVESKDAVPQIYYGSLSVDTLDQTLATGKTRSLKVLLSGSKGVQSLLVSVASNNPNIVRNTISTCTLSDTNNVCNIPIITESSITKFEGESAIITVTPNTGYLTPITSIVRVKSVQTGSLVMTDSNVFNSGQTRLLKLVYTGDSFGVESSTVAITTNSSGVKVASSSCVISDTNRSCDVYVTGVNTDGKSITFTPDNPKISPLTQSIVVNPQSYGQLKLNVTNFSDPQITKNMSLELLGSSGIGSQTFKISSSTDPVVLSPLNYTCIISSDTPSCYFPVSSLYTGTKDIIATPVGNNFYEGKRESLVVLNSRSVPIIFKGTDSSPKSVITLNAGSVFMGLLGFSSNDNANLYNYGVTDVAVTSSDSNVATVEFDNSLSSCLVMAFAACNYYINAKSPGTTVVSSRSIFGTQQLVVNVTTPTSFSLVSATNLSLNRVGYLGKQTVVAKLNGNSTEAIPVSLSHNLPNKIYTLVPNSCSLSDSNPFCIITVTPIPQAYDNTPYPFVISATAPNYNPATLNATLQDQWSQTKKGELFLFGPKALFVNQASDNNALVYTGVVEPDYPTNKTFLLNSLRKDILDVYTSSCSLGIENEYCKFSIKANLPGNAQIISPSINYVQNGVNYVVESASITIPVYDFKFTTTSVNASVGTAKSLTLQLFNNENIGLAQLKSGTATATINGGSMRLSANTCQFDRNTGACTIAVTPTNSAAVQTVSATITIGGATATSIVTVNVAP